MKEMTKEEIKRLADSFSLDRGLLERHLAALNIALKLQQFDQNIQLFGGTAAQFFFPTPFQRTSTDVDFISNYSYPKINNLIEEFCKSEKVDPNTIERKKLRGAYGISYFFPKKFHFPGSGSIKVDMVSTREKLISGTKVVCSLYGMSQGKFRMIRKADIFSKKLVTLDLDNVGLYRKDESGEYDFLHIGKQIYDLGQLYNSLTIGEVVGLSENIQKQFENNIRTEHDCNVDDCLENVCDVLQSLSLVGVRGGRNSDSELFNRCLTSIKSHVPRNGWPTIPQWASAGWTFEHLLRCVLNDIHEGTEANIVKHFEIRDKLKADTLTNGQLLIDCMAKLTASKVAKPIKGKPLYSLYFKCELLDGKI